MRSVRQQVTEAFVADLGAAQRWMLALRTRGSSDIALDAWGAWIDLALAEGIEVFGAASSAEVGVKAQRLGITVKGTRAAVARVVAATGASAEEVAACELLARNAAASAAWVAEDEAGFEGGFAAYGVAPIALRAALPNAGVARLLVLSEALGLGARGAVDEVRRVVNPGGQATSIGWTLDDVGDAIVATWGRALVALGLATDAGTSGIGALVERRAAGAGVQLRMTASERGVTQVALRVPVADPVAVATGLALIGATQLEDEHAARVVGVLGTDTPGWVELSHAARGLELRLGALRV